MPVALVAVAAVGAGLSVYQTIDAKKKEKEAKQAADQYKRQELTNPAQNIQVSTRGSDLQKEAVNTQVSTALDGLRFGGSRAIMGGMPNLYDFMMRSNQQIAANLDQQENDNQKIIADGNASVQRLNEQRERDDLLGIGNAISVANNQYNGGITNTIQSGSAMISAANEINSNGIGIQKMKPISSNNMNNKIITSTPNINVNKPNYDDMINEYNRMIYGTRRR